METKEGKPYYLMCERSWIYHILMMISGFFGAYTYLLRGNVFCNAQTGNVVLMGMALGLGKWKEGFYYLIPISAYIFGAFVSELLPNTVKRHFPVRWDTLLIAIEMAAVFFLGILPENAPVQIAQITINFIASMQYNTFRQAEGIPVATTFATNHIRQIGIGFAKLVQKKTDEKQKRKFHEHLAMLLYFAGGVFAGTVFGTYLLGKSIWITLIPFAVVFWNMLYADLYLEKDMKNRKPSGH